MNKPIIEIDLGEVQETLMLPLWARARETEIEKNITPSSDPLQTLPDRRV